jgi:hypothetical protein
VTKKKPPPLDSVVTSICSVFFCAKTKEGYIFCAIATEVTIWQKNNWRTEKADIGILTQKQKWSKTVS